MNVGFLLITDYLQCSVTDGATFWINIGEGERVTMGSPSTITQNLDITIAHSSILCTSARPFYL